MKDIVEFIVKQFVSNPDAVEVNEETQDGFVNVTLKVAPEDMGLTIGKSGQTIKAIRRLLTIKAIAENVRVNLELVDSGVKPEADQNDSEESDKQSLPPSEIKQSLPSNDGKSEDKKASEPESKASETTDLSDKSDTPSPSEETEETKKDETS